MTVEEKSFVGVGNPLTEADLESALEILGMDPVADMPLLWAVLTVESRGFGFLRNRRPKTLFERHIFFRETDGRFSGSDPDICAKTGGGYVGGDSEFGRLQRALVLCRSKNMGDEPALRSASWGLGQVMGFNAEVAGFTDASDMANQMCRSEGVQLDAMIRFISGKRLDGKLRKHDWTGFARSYNGSGYWKEHYDLKLKSAYEKFSSGITRDLRVRAAQAGLLFLGYRPGDPDGILGQNTRRTIVAFRQDTRLGDSEELDDEVFAAIMRAAGLHWK
ncbi:N-acetylmuramidase domain-containing protein [Rhizobacter fulvus]